MQSKAEDKEWGVKTIKQRRSDEHGNIEFLVEWDGDWIKKWSFKRYLEMPKLQSTSFYVVDLRAIQRQGYVAYAKTKSRPHGAS